MDSIRENQKLEDLVTSLKMELDNDYEYKLSIVLVEGSDEVKLINKIFDDNIVCYESFSGKHGLDDLIGNDKIIDNRIIAIRDKDYCDIQELPDRMYTYDTCCMETMIINNEEIRKSLFDTYYTGNNDKELLYDKIVKELKPISVLRRKNEKENLQLNFNRMGLLNCYDETNCLDINKIFENMNLSQNIRDECIREVENTSSDELLDITNGHDLCKILGKIMQSGNGDMGENRVRDALICSFRKNDFKQTDLYDKLLKYQQQHNLKYVEE